MKKNYELLQVNVISLGNEDVITASGSATRGIAEDLLGDSSIGIGTQNFTY